MVERDGLVLGRIETDRLSGFDHAVDFERDLVIARVVVNVLDSPSTTTHEAYSGIQAKDIVKGIDEVRN